MCRNTCRRVVFVEVFICFTDNFNALVLWYICVKTCDVHQNKKCLFFHSVFSIEFMKSVVSLRNDFCIFDIGCCNVSTKEEILSVGPSQPKIIGLPVMVGL